MRAAVESVFVAVVSAAALLLTASAAAAQPPAEAATTATPYEQCVDVGPTIRACSTGVITTRQSTTPSGITSGSVIDNGRVESVDSATGCTVKSSYHFSDRFMIGPEALGRITVDNSSRLTARTRCGDQTGDAPCVLRITTSVLLLPDEATVTSRVWSQHCDG